MFSNTYKILINFPIQVTFISNINTLQCYVMYVRKKDSIRYPTYSIFVVRKRYSFQLSDKMNLKETIDVPSYLLPFFSSKLLSLEILFFFFSFQIYMENGHSLQIT